MNPVINILEVESGIWILEEEGQNVLLKDCQRFGIGKETRKALMDIMSLTATYLAKGESLEPLIELGLLKKLQRQESAVQTDLWEARLVGRGGRLLFVMKRPDSIIVSAVDKNKGSLSQAINRGVKRWREFLKERELSQWPTHWD
jgi:hypothetical protein